MKYMVVEADSGSRLAEIVNKQIKEGWEPFGGVCVVVQVGERPFYIQAMIKNDKND